MSLIFEFFAYKVGYFLVATGALIFIRRFLPSWDSPHYLEKRLRFQIVFRYFNGMVLIGYAWLVVAGPFASVYWPHMGYFQSLLLDDTINFGLIILYLLGYLGQNYLIDRKTRYIQESYLSYLAGFGFYWLLILTLLMFFRFDYYYLPIWSAQVSPLWETVLEIGSVLLFLGFQGLILGVRRLKMTQAPPELRQLVDEVAAEFGIKIRNVRVWKLDRVTNAFATGLILKSVFVTENMIEHASEADLRMIIGHECAHFARHHLILRTLLLGGMVLVASFILDQFPRLSWPFYVGAGITGVFLYKIVSRMQEFEADRVAAIRLGGGRKMAEALTEVFGLAAIPTRFGLVIRWLIGHPDPESRIRKLTKI